MNNLTGSIGLASEDTAAQAARLRRVLRWMATIGFVVAPFDLTASVMQGSPTRLVAGIIAASVGSAALLGIALVRRGRLHAAALTIAAALLIVCFVVSIALPALTTITTLLPLLVIALLLPYLPSRTMLVLSAVALVVAVATFLIAALLPPLLPRQPPAEAIMLGTIGVAACSAITLLLLWQFSNRLQATIAATRAANVALEHARAALEDMVAERTTDLRAALADVQARVAVQAQLLDENNQQRSAIREMSVPVLPVSARAIVIPLIGALDSERLQMIQEQALHAIEHSTTRYVLLDITGVPVVDTHVAAGLLNVVHAARLLGTEVVLVGVRPEVAQTIVALGLDLRGMPTRQSLQDGIAYTVQRELSIGN